jgi:hypothetical protein
MRAARRPLMRSQRPGRGFRIRTSRMLQSF